ncbi:MAG: glycosyltransferase family 4 protein [Nostoc sp.]
MISRQTQYARVAMYLNRPESRAENEGIYGRDIAIDSFLKALLQHGEPGHYQFFQNCNFLNVATPVQTQIEQIVNERSDTSLMISDIAEIKGAFEQFNFRVWHDMDGDLYSPVALRSNYSNRLYPITATSHAVSYQGLLHGWLGLMLQKIYPCDSIICTSRAVRKAVTNLFDHVAERLRITHNIELSFKGRLDIIPLGVDTDVFRPRNKLEVRRQLGLPEEAFLILWLGRISFLDKADLLPLVQVFKRLLKENPSRNLVLLVSGSGHPLFTKMIQHYAKELGISDCVLFKEPLPPQQRHLFHAAADVFTSPVDSIQETFGITPIEAMACGVPQVVSDWNGYRDTVQHEETGFLIPTYWAKTDSDACLQAGIYDEYNLFDHLLLAQSTAVDLDMYQIALQTLINNEELRQQMAQSSRKRALSQYRWSAVIRAYENLWTELAEVAKDLTYKPDPNLDFTVPAFFEVFGHYTTTVLSGNVCLYITETGQRILSGDEILPLYMKHWGILSQDLLTETLDFLKGINQPIDLHSLEKGLHQKTKFPLETIRRHILWLVKYGCVHKC